MTRSMSKTFATTLRPAANTDVTSLGKGALILFPESG